ncbi:mechanosensitive ion channel domain-containing protein [Lewinella sp. LCG006]|uniref:mechanosensitive ion channel domain-containing protein n=1 Tax=Lewinella sp. LCG006 TaxID=3231911 RepID=UPI00345F9952
MEGYKIQIIESLVLIVVLLISSKVLQRIIDKAGMKYTYHKTRIKVIKKVVSLLLSLVFIGVLLLIWGIAPAQLVAYIASLFTVVGIAFLAQWSIVSNITSTLIIFFNHQVNIGDKIVILDKDYQVEGKISDIGIFFIIIKVSENEYVSMPSNVFMQKMVKKIRQ